VRRSFVDLGILPGEPDIPTCAIEQFLPATC
jgi:hypothetical protein